jgi:tetratricopeptide (TPR) repeat protein
MDDASPLDRAQQKIEAQDPDGAIADLTAFLEGQPGHAYALRFRGWARLNKQDHAGALADFDASLGAAPGDEWTMFRRAMCLYQLRRYPECQAAYDQVIAKDPNHAMAHFNRGLAHEVMGNAPAALGDFERAAVLDPNDPDAPKRRDALRGKLAGGAPAVSKNSLLRNPLIAWPIRIVGGLVALALALGCFYLAYLAGAHSVSVIMGNESGKILTPLIGAVVLGGIGLGLLVVGFGLFVTPPHVLAGDDGDKK